MGFQYEVAGEFADHVHALALIESNENPVAIGDDGRAFSLLQLHPDFYDGWCCARVGDSWATAQIRAVARYLTTMVTAHGLDLAIQSFHLGVGAVLREGKRDPDYLARFTDALQKIRGTK